MVDYSIQHLQDEWARLMSVYYPEEPILDRYKHGLCKRIAVIWEKYPEERVVFDAKIKLGIDPQLRKYKGE